MVSHRESGFMKILSQENAAIEITQNPGMWNVVSIRDSQSRYCPVDAVEHLCKTLLKVFFDDVYSDKYKNSYQKLVTLEDIKTIIEFAVGKKDLLIHCVAGVSRSSAVAYIISCTLESPWDAIRRLNPEDHLPNDLVVRLGAKLLDNQDIWNAFISTYGPMDFIC
jgi:predicted protein tyrosine phosphatase